MTFIRTSANLLKSNNAIPQTSKVLAQKMTSSPMLNSIFQNKQGLIETSKSIPFNTNKWNYNPQQFSFDQYENQYYYPVILIVNNIGSIYDFYMTNFPNGIITPEISLMQNIINRPSPMEAL